mmetsp:Transcript_5969/g.9703  ORF Transcript_5969/g.9703 Transcript_5969/m.9703 type:complete len:476 (+) Transcript_5969:187-1614(+)
MSTISISINDNVDEISPDIGSYENMLDILCEDEENEGDVRMSHWLSTRGVPGGDARRTEEAIERSERRAAVATGDRSSQARLIPTFGSESLQFKLSTIYGHDFGSLPFDMAGVENENAYLVQPEDRKIVEKNYQLLTALKVFQDSLVSIYGPVADRVLSGELRTRVLSEGLTAELIEKAHIDAVKLYKAEKAAKLKKIEDMGELWRNQSREAKALSVDKMSEHGTGFYTSPPKAISVNLIDEGADCFLEDVDLHRVGEVDDKVGDIKDDEKAGDLSEVDFVSDYNISVMDAKKAFAKNWVVMKAAEFELQVSMEGLQSAKDDVEVLESRQTFCRLTETEKGPLSSTPDLVSRAGESLEETDMQLLVLGEELNKVIDFENFYRALRKKPKVEFKDSVLIKDIVDNIDILIKVVVKKRKDLEGQIWQLKRVRMRIKLVNRPLPRLLLGAVLRGSETGSSSASGGASVRTRSVASEHE